MRALAEQDYLLLLPLPELYPQRRSLVPLPPTLSPLLRLTMPSYTSRSLLERTDALHFGSYISQVPLPTASLLWDTTIHAFLLRKLQSAGDPSRGASLANRLHHWHSQVLWARELPIEPRHTSGYSTRPIHLADSADSEELLDKDRPVALHKDKKEHI